MKYYYPQPIIYDNGIVLPQDEVFVDIGILVGLEPEKYLISNYGRVFSIISMRFLEPYIHNGYKFIALGSRYRDFVHRLVAFAFVPGMTEERNCVNHIDGDKLNNYYKNLEWCSKLENNRHAYATHLNNCIGENCRSAKLTNEKVHEICALLQDGRSIKEILNIIGMEDTLNNYEIIRSIRKGYAWKSISKDYDVGYTEHAFNSISDEEVHKICQCYQNGMSIKETYEFVYHKSYDRISECDKYNILANIRRRFSHKDISANYVF